MGPSEIIDICDIFEIFWKVSDHKNFPSRRILSIFLKILKNHNAIFQMRRLRASDYF